MSFFFENLARIASYGPQIDQSHGENRLSHIIIRVIPSVIPQVLVTRTTRSNSNRNVTQSGVLRSGSIKACVKTKGVVYLLQYSR